MTDMKAKSTGGRALSELVRKEIGSETNRNFLARLPSFQLETEMPDRLSELLGQLDRAQATADGQAS